MPNVALKKSDKIEALKKLIQKKFNARYEKLMERRLDLTQKVYDETYGKVGYAAKAAVGKDWNTWLETASQVDISGIKQPKLMTKTGRKVMGSDEWKDFFTGRQLRTNTVTLRSSVVKPARKFGWYLKAEDASSSTKRKIQSLNKSIDDFNAEIKEYWNRAYMILMSIRTSRQVDSKFPELWDYLPDGTRERIKQALVVPQEVIDQFRKDLP